jgi:hypothetical protein
MHHQDKKWPSSQLERLARTKTSYLSLLYIFEVPIEALHLGGDSYVKPKRLRLLFEFYKILLI